LLPDGHPDHAAIQAEIGNVYAELSSTDDALTHYQRAVRHCMEAGDTYHAGQIRYNSARLLYYAGRYRDALDWARAALLDFETVGAGATQMINLTEQLSQAVQRAIDGGLSNR